MKKPLIILAISLMVFGLFLTTSQIARAAGLTSVTDVMSRLKAATASNHTIKFTTAAGMSSGTIVVDFNTAGFTSGTVDYTDIDLSYGAGGTENEQTIAADAGAATWGATITGNNLTLAYPTSGATAITAGWIVIIEIGTNAATGVQGDQRYTNPAAGSKTISISGTGTFTNSGSLAVAIATEDQVDISATVDPYLAFDVTDDTVTLGTLSTTLIKTDTAAMTAATNSTSGYSITVNGGTLDDGAGHTITAIGAAHAASSVGNEQFGFRIAAVGGAGAPVDPYDDVAQYAFDSAAVPDQVASDAGVSATTTYTITYMANISATTEPGAYTATHTYICTGNF